jgi:hypothetical protein
MINSIIQESIRALLGLKLFICLTMNRKGLIINRILFQEVKKL